jgi:hypothetical protein
MMRILTLKRSVVPAVAGVGALALVVLMLPPGRAPSSTNAQSPGAYRLAIGGLAADGFAPTVSISKSTAYQGGAIEVKATNATAGQVTVLGRTYVLEPGAGNGVSGFVGFGTDDPPGPATLDISVTGIDGQATETTRPFTILATDWTVEDIVLPPGPSEILDDPAKINAEAAQDAAIYSKVTPRKWLDTWAAPVPISQADITSYFGEQRSYNGGPPAGHHGGTDIGVPAGTPVHATNDGTVVLAQLTYVRGNFVIIDHGGGVFTGYGHMQSLAVTAGQTVKQGDILGYVGQTGLATGPHLHWEMSVGGQLVDALRWLDGTQGF